MSNERLAALAAENKRMREALESILKPFPAVIGSAEDMLDDYTSAVSRFRATARAALGKPPNTHCTCNPRGHHVPEANRS